MIASPFLSDTTILTAPESGLDSALNAHRFLLAARCPGFREAIKDADPLPNVLDLSEFERNAVLAFLEYVYCGVCPVAMGANTSKKVDAIRSRYKTLNAL